MLQDKNNLSGTNNLVDAATDNSSAANTSLIDASVNEPSLEGANSPVNEWDTKFSMEETPSVSEPEITFVVEDSPVEEAEMLFSTENKPPVNEWDTTPSLEETVKKEEVVVAPEDTNPVTIPTSAPKQEFGDVRYNPVTGEEMNINEVKDEVNNVEKLKTVEVEYKPTNKGNTIFLVLFFIFLLGFIIFLPDIVSIIDAYKAGRGNIVLEEIPTGKLVCTLDTNTINLDKSIERIFYYEELKLKSSKFSTTIRGDATLDEEALQELYNQCSQIKENIDGYSGINVSCDLSSDTLIEKESFDYEKYNAEEISTAYSEAGGSLVEFQYEQDIDKIMYLMKQGGFKCNKEK